MGDKAIKTIIGMLRILRAVLHQRTRVSLGLARSAISIWVLAIAALLSACSSSTPTVTSAPQQTVASSTPSATVTPKPTVTPNPTATPGMTAIPAETGTPQLATAQTALDPCQLLPSQEASSLAGTSFGAGTEGTIPGGVNTCTYGSQSTNIFLVQVVQAPDEATADAAKQQFLSDLQAKMQQASSQGITVTQLPNFADGAVIGEASISANGINFNGSAIGFRKGTTFFGFSDVVVGGPAPSSAALQAEATTVLGRLP